jgi:phage terminase large subunit GpA-like protein
MTPPPSLGVDEWADEYRHVMVSARPGKYRTSVTPYVVEPMQRLGSGDKCRVVVLMWPSQSGKSEIGNNWIGYTAHYDPVPFIMMQPSVGAAKRYSKMRVDKMIEDTPVLRGLFGGKKSRDGSNTWDQKAFPGGFLLIVGANAPADLASTPAARAFVDEGDRCSEDAGTEGDSVGLLTARLTTYGKTSKMLMTSTPTTAGRSRIETSMSTTGYRRWWVPCPHCGEMQPLWFDRLNCDGQDHTTAWYDCANDACDTPIYERHKTRMLAGGEWRPDFPERETGETYGYHLNGMYSPTGMFEWDDMLREFFEADGDPKKTKVFVNTRIAETYDEFDGEDIDGTGLISRAEEYAAPVPAGVSVITAGVDVQGDRVECEVVGWGPGEESWSIEYKVIPGDPSGAAVWLDLEAFLSKTWRHETAGPMGISAAGIDCGHETTKVQAFTHKHRRRRWFAVKGLAGEGKPLWPNRGKRGKKGRGEMFHGVGTNDAKATNWRRLQRIDPGPGYLHFPVGRDLSWYEQLVSEIPRTTYVKNHPRKEWVRRSASAKAEALDCRVYAYCVLYSLLRVGRTLESMHAGLPDLTPAQAQRAMDAPQAAPPVRRKALEHVPAKKPKRQRKRPGGFKARF